MPPYYVLKTVISEPKRDDVHKLIKGTESVFVFQSVMKGRGFTCTFSNSASKFQNFPEDPLSLIILWKTKKKKSNPYVVTFTFSQWYIAYINYTLSGYHEQTDSNFSTYTMYMIFVSIKCLDFLSIDSLKKVRADIDPYQPASKSARIWHDVALKTDANQSND